jgi:hypothetical protein
MEKNKNTFTFRVLNLGNTISIPEYKESYNGLWFNYGNDNLYPNYLLDLYNYRSNKHKALINRKSNMIYGDGFEVTPGNEIILKNIEEDDTLNEILMKISYDLEIFNGFCLLVKWTNNGNKVGALKYVPFSSIRIGTDKNYYYSTNWKEYRKKEYAPIPLNSFNPETSFEDKIQLYYYNSYVPSLDHIYTVPSYSSTINWIEADWEISNFHLNSIKNGFNAGFILNFATGIPTPEEMEQHHKEFVKNYTGTNNSGKFILTYSDGQDQKPEMTPIQLSDSDSRYLQLSESIRNEIFIGHQVTNPQLFGVMIPGSLGGKNELLESLEIFQATYIQQKQRGIEGVFNKIYKNNGYTDFKINQFKI